jgi:hypothetical protein
VSVVKKKKINNRDFVNDIIGRLNAGLAKYGDALRISANPMGCTVRADIENVFGMCVTLSVEVDLFRGPKGPKGTPVQVIIRASATREHSTPGKTYLLAAMMQDAALVGQIIEVAYCDTYVYLKR